ncbi:MAG TPA: molybdopterin synthase catalytic subunit MoaE [Pseudohongiella sp.]|nr:molybdopterin synthase catalytic subunit MoaE [Pseudohongiella sp.]HDZ09820.1 molybdopterin synthase catalytic subunit MoaE [Pseudohongiella sp.]HEA61566.1 molybdopterin synthase catalytic subunit MoaE [Pseudohongiella sp.]
MIRVDVQPQDFDLATEYASVRDKADNPGAVTIFSGLVRELQDSGSAEQSLTLEHYPGMTEKALQDIAEQAADRWPLSVCRIIHRVGTLQPGDQIVLVATASSHREAAFEAAHFIMDYLKTSAPFWKKQVTGTQNFWVDSRTSDHEAAARWQNKQGAE